MPTTLVHEIDECPVHHADIAREYDFGMGDATVVKWACGCCGTFGEQGPGHYHLTYPAAAAQARLMTASNAAKYR